LFVLFQEFKRFSTDVPLAAFINEGRDAINSRCRGLLDIDHSGRLERWNQSNRIHEPLTIRALFTYIENNGHTVYTRPQENKNDFFSGIVVTTLQSMLHDTLALVFLLIMIVGAFMYRKQDPPEETIRIEKPDPPILEHENKLGLHGRVVNALYDCVEHGVDVSVEPTSFDVPSHGIVNHMVKQLCLRASNDELEFFHTSTVYAGTRVYTDDAKLHDVCCIVHERSTLSTVRLRFIALCDSEDDGVVFVSMRFDPLDTAPGDMEYMRSGDCIPCHHSLKHD